MLALVSDFARKVWQRLRTQAAFPREFSTPSTLVYTFALSPLPKGKSIFKPVWDPEGPSLGSTSAATKRQRHSSRGPEASPLLGCSGRDAPAGALAPIPSPRTLAPCLRGRAGKGRGPLSLHEVALPGAAARPGHPPRRRSSLRASSASSQVAATDSRPGTSSPRATGVPPPRRRASPVLNFPGAQRGLRPQWPGAGVCTTPGAAGRCARGPPRGPGASGRAEAERRGRDRGAGRGRGRGDAPLASADSAPLPGELRCGNRPECRAQGLGRAGGGDRVSAAREP